MRCHACDTRTDTRTVESRAVFSLSWIRNYNEKYKAGFLILFHRDSVDCLLRRNDQIKILNTKVRVYPCFPLRTLHLLHLDRRLEHLKTLKKLMWVLLEIDQAEKSARQCNLSFKNIYMLNTFPLDSSICLLLTSKSIVLSQRLSPSLKTFTIFFYKCKIITKVETCPLSKLTS